MNTQKKNNDAGAPRQTEEDKKEKDPVVAAHKAADKDIEKDPDMELPTATDDLDEGELANLGGDKNDLV